MAQQTEPDILSYANYRTIKHPVPYEFQLRGSSAELYYFGTEHISAPESPCFAKICTSFERFRPDAVLVEAISPLSYENSAQERKEYLSSIAFESREIAVRQGERFLGVSLALEYALHIECPEPKVQTMLEALHAAGNLKEQIIGMYGVRALAMHHLYRADWSAKEFCQHRLDILKDGSDWDKSLFTVDAVIVAAEERGISIDWSNLPKLGIHIDPTQRISDDPSIGYNDLVRTESRFRDLAIVSRIVALTEKFQRLYVLYGATHAVMQEAALRRHFES